MLEFCIYIYMYIFSIWKNIQKDIMIKELMDLYATNHMFCRVWYIMIFPSTTNLLQNFYSIMANGFFLFLLFFFVLVIMKEESSISNMSWLSSIIRKSYPSLLGTHVKEHKTIWTFNIHNLLQFVCEKDKKLSERLKNPTQVHT